MNAKIFNEIRRILFCAANDPKKGFSTAFEWLEGYKDRKNIDIQSYVGLKAELSFYQKFKKDFALTVAGDMGEHADFAGFIDKTPVRIDVTTNASYKSLKEYEPFLCDGFDYKIAIFDSKNFEIIDVLDLAFHKCTSCGESHAFPIALLLSENFNSKGESKWSNDQLLIDICPICSHFEEKQRFEHQFLFSPSEFVINLTDMFDEHEANTLIDNYIADQYRYMKKLFNVELMGIAENTYEITDQKGGGFWGVSFNFKNGIVEDKLPRIIETGIIA